MNRITTSCVLAILLLTFGASLVKAHDECIFADSFGGCDCVPLIVELCDGLDNTCDGVVDETCISIPLYVLPPVSCPGLFNGGATAAGANGQAFIVEFPGGGSNPGTLHIAERDGTVNEDVNTGLPDGARTIVRSDSDRIFVAGRQTSPEAEHQIFELNPTTGANLAPPFFTALGADVGFFYTSSIAVDSSDNVFIAASSGGAIYQVGDEDLTEYGTGVGNNNAMIFSDDDETLFVAGGGKFGTVAQGGTFEELHSRGGYTPVAMVRDASGYIYTAWNDFCDFNCSPPSAFVERVNPDGTNPIMLVTTAENTIKGFAYDPLYNELLIYSDIGTNLIEGCNSAAGTIMRFVIQ